MNKLLTLYDFYVIFIKKGGILMVVYKKMPLNLLKMSMIFLLIFSLSCFSVKVSANEISDDIFNNWKVIEDKNFGSMYLCPEMNPETDSIIEYCMSVAENKKGNLISDEYSAVLCFSYDLNRFSSNDEFIEYYRNNIYYPFFCIYPDTSFSASVKAYYGMTYDSYRIILEICVNGKSHANYTGNQPKFEKDDAEKQLLAEEIRRLASEASGYSDDQKEQLRYIFDYLYKNVRYGLENERASTSYGAVIDKLAVCQGYTMAVQDICYLLDIPCIMNFSQSDNHGWNSVFVDGEWQLIDATNGYFMPMNEKSATELLPIHHFDTEFISSMQRNIMKFYNLRLMGDIDNNYYLTSEDALQVLNYNVGLVDIPEEDLKYADLDKDGKLTSGDVLIILQKVVGL